MYPLLALPRWLVAGLVLGVVFSLMAAAVFLVGARMFPEPRSGGEGRRRAEDRRRAEIRAYLSAIGESYAEDHPVAGHPVAFYLPERDVAITFDARAFFRIRGTTDTQAVLVEHELPGWALGARLPFETPVADGVTGDAGESAGVAGETAVVDPAEPTAEAFEALDLPRTAGVGEVRAAYREKVKSVHPDQGGDPDEFRRLREAYAVAREAAA